jgi:NAD(P)-dependent dehydrogenase (short-subunit alcohol dehydrogenase family)
MAALSEKIALVTGASRGLGYAVALKLAAEGAHVIALARTVGGLEELDDAITAAGGVATLTPLDITDDAGLERLGAAIHGRWGKLDLLVHCAAQDSPLSPAEHTAVKDFDKAMKVNARATQRLIRVIDPLLKAADNAQGVFTDDESASGQKFNTAYGASKAAARAIVQSYAAESQRNGAQVWLANPPAMPTAIRARAHPGEDQSTLTSCETVAQAIVSHIINGDIAAGQTAKF